MSSASPLTWCSPAWRGLSCALVVAVLLFGSLVNPLGLLLSHGSAELAALEHGSSAGDLLDHGHDHRHVHDHHAFDLHDEHGHHGGDHSHDTAHAVPADLLRAGFPNPVLRPAPHDPARWPLLAGLERPPRA